VLEEAEELATGLDGVASDAAVRTKVVGA
jgi:hypothetical protein